jgi:hypothetical protein
MSLSLSSVVRGEWRVVDGGDAWIEVCAKGRGFG